MQIKDAEKKSWVVKELKKESKFELYDETSYNNIFSVTLEKIKKQLPFNLKILEVGSSTGSLSNQLFKKGFKNITAFDISEEAIQIGKRNNPVIKFLQADAECLPYKSETFDIIFCIDVQHHFSDFSKMASEMIRVLKKGGYLFTVDPNKSNPHIFLLMSYFSPVRYDFLTINENPISDKNLINNYVKFNMKINIYYKFLILNPAKTGYVKNNFWFKPLFYKYIGFLLNSYNLKTMKGFLKFCLAILLFNFIHIIQKFLPNKYRSNAIIFSGEKK